MLLFFTINMAAMTSRANRQYDMYLVIRQVVNKQGYWFFESCSTLNLFRVFLVKITHLERSPYLVIWKNHEKPFSHVSGSVFNKIVEHKIVNTQMHATERTFLWGKGGSISIGSLTNDDDDGSENVAKKMNLRPFKLYRVYVDPLNLSNAGDFSWSWILEDFIQVENGKFVVVCSRPTGNVALGGFMS